MPKYEVPKVADRYVHDDGDICEVIDVSDLSNIVVQDVGSGKQHYRYNLEDFHKFYTRQVNTPEKERKIEYAVGQVWSHPRQGTKRITKVTNRLIYATRESGNPDAWARDSKFESELTLIETKKETEMITCKEKKYDFKVGQVYAEEGLSPIEITKVTKDRIYYIRDGDSCDWNEPGMQSSNLTLIKETKMNVKNVAKSTVDFAGKSAKNILWNWPLKLIGKAIMFSFINPAKKATKPAKFVLEYALFSTILAGIGYGGWYTWDNGEEMYQNIRIPSVNIEWDAPEAEVVSSDPFGEDTV